MNALKMYKVLFTDHKAVTSAEVDFSARVAVDTDNVDGKLVLRSITIFAADEAGSMTTAQEIAKYLR